MARNRITVDSFSASTFRTTGYARVVAGNGIATQAGGTFILLSMAMGVVAGDAE